jgi:hypothetical protein
MYITNWLYELPVPPPQQLLNELTMLDLSGCLLKLLHDHIIEFLHVKHTIHKGPYPT